MSQREQTPQAIKAAISVINQLRVHPSTKDIYAEVDGDSYDEYLQMLSQWIRHTENPVRMEECCIGGERFEIEFTFYPSEPAMKLFKLYATVTLGWSSVEYSKNEENTLTMIIGI